MPVLVLLLFLVLSTPKHNGSSVKLHSRILQDPTRSYRIFNKINFNILKDTTKIRSCKLLSRIALNFQQEYSDGSKVASVHEKGQFKFKLDFVKFIIIFNVIIFCVSYSTLGQPESILIFSELILDKVRSKQFLEFWKYAME